MTKGNVTFVEMETAIFTLMLGALGLGIALGDLGDQQEGLQVAKRVFQSIDDGNKLCDTYLVDTGDFICFL